MHLHRRQIDRLQSVIDGITVMGKCAGIDDNTVRIPKGFMDTVDDGALVVGLEKFQIHVEPLILSFLREGVLNVLQGFRAVDLRLPHAQHIEVGTIDH